MSAYGVSQFQRALKFTRRGGKALDVGCGTGGWFVRILHDNHFSVTGLDVSKEMIRLARTNHREHKFLHQDICSWETEEKFEVIVAWDSIFHLPLDMQKPVVSKLCQFIAKGGILIYTFSNDQGEHTDQWHDDIFYYSSIGINENVQILLNSGLSILHLELDQYPEKHVYVFAIKS